MSLCVCACARVCHTLVCVWLICISNRNETVFQILAFSCDPPGLFFFRFSAAFLMLSLQTYGRNTSLIAAAWQPPSFFYWPVYRYNESYMVLMYVL